MRGHLPSSKLKVSRDLHHAAYPCDNEHMTLPALLLIAFFMTLSPFRTVSNFELSVDPNNMSLVTLRLSNPPIDCWLPFPQPAEIGEIHQAT